MSLDSISMAGTAATWLGSMFAPAAGGTGALEGAVSSLAAGGTAANSVPAILQSAGLSGAGMSGLGLGGDIAKNLEGALGGVPNFLDNPALEPFNPAGLTTAYDPVANPSMAASVAPGMMGGTPNFATDPRFVPKVKQIDEPNPWMTGIGAGKDVLKEAMQRRNQPPAAPSPGMHAGGTHPLSLSSSARTRKPSALERYAMLLRRL